MRVKYNDKQVMDAVREQGRKHITKLSIMVEGFAKVLCPVGKSRPGYVGGNLRRSITHDVQVNEDIIIGQVGTPVKYAPYVELGTRRMAARPYLRPALYGVIGRDTS